METGRLEKRSTTKRDEVKGRLIETIELENGLTLDLWNESRELVGDRWVVTLMARIDIPILPENIPIEEVPYEKVREVLGDQNAYIHRKTRHFIPRQKVPEVLGQLKERFLENAIEYLSHPSFARRFVMKKWKEIEKNRL